MSYLIQRTDNYIAFEMAIKAYSYSRVICDESKRLKYFMYHLNRVKKESDKFRLVMFALGIQIKITSTLTLLTKTIEFASDALFSKIKYEPIKLLNP